MWPATQRGAAIAEERGKSWEPGVLSVARIVPVIPIGPDSLAGALEVLIDLVADANNPDRGKSVFGSEEPIRMTIFRALMPSRCMARASR